MKSLPITSQKPSRKKEYLPDTLKDVAKRVYKEVISAQGYHQTYRIPNKGKATRQVITPINTVSARNRYFNYADAVDNILDYMIDNNTQLRNLSFCKEIVYEAQQPKDEKLRGFDKTAMIRAWGRRGYWFYLLNNIIYLSIVKLNI